MSPYTFRDRLGAIGTIAMQAIPMILKRQHVEKTLFRDNENPFLETAMPEKILAVDMSTGVAEMDRLHYDFYEALSALAALPDNEFALGFRNFVCHVERFFYREEQWMESSDFSADKSHREQHARVLSALHHVHSRVLAGDIATGRETIETLLPQWFAFHISTMDMALAAAMQVSELPYRMSPATISAPCYQ